MSREEIHKLASGYATGTLTPEERQALFQAALEDQDLFDMLAADEALRDLLGDPVSKAQVLAAIEEQSSRWYERLGWLRPAAAVLAMAGLAAVGVIWWRHNAAPRALESQPAVMAELKPAQVKPAEVEPSAPPVPPAAPEAADKAAAPPVVRPPASAPRRESPVPTALDQLARASGGLVAPKEKSERDSVSGSPLADARPAAPPPPAVAAPAPVPAPTLQGTVTDSAGAVLPGATVTVGQNNLAPERQTRTDAQGNWSIAIPSPGPYQVRADAPGFQTAHAVIDTPLLDTNDMADAKKKLNLQLQPGVATETVQVSAGAAILPFQQAATQQAPVQLDGAPQQLEQMAKLQQATNRAVAPAPAAPFGGGGVGGARPLGARQLYEQAAAQVNGAAPRAATTNAALATPRSPIGPPFGLQYTLLPVTPGGGDGNTVQIRFTPTADGRLTVTNAAGVVLAATRVERLKPYLSPPLPRGGGQIAVTYSLLVQAPAAKAASKDAVEAQQPPVRPIQETIAGITYIAARAAQGSLSFTIDLK